ncbi:MAG: WbqC family protein [Pseudomonadales bacterium]
MIISINQPAYLPWLGYFDRINAADIHVELDTVQFEKNSMVNRNKIKLNGTTAMLTVPVKTKGKFGDLAISEIEIADNRWARKHWSSIKQSYGKANYFSDHKDFFEHLYSTSWTKLNPLLAESNQYLYNALGIQTQVCRAREINAVGTKHDLVLNICKELGATSYLSGPFGKDYLKLDQFNEANIEVIFQDYHHPKYDQQGNTFEPYLSIVDLLFNHGKKSLITLSTSMENSYG